jgi:hypothetical protein
LTFERSGDVGATGATGLAGGTGGTGGTGGSGGTGGTGAAGADGTNGTNGTNGATGATGPTGPGNNVTTAAGTSITLASTDTKLTTRANGAGGTSGTAITVPSGSHTVLVTMGANCTYAVDGNGCVMGFQASPTGSTSASVTNKALTTNVATLTVTNSFVVGDNIIVNIGDPIFDGTWVITARNGTTVSYADTHANVGSAATTGTMTDTGSIVGVAPSSASSVAICCSGGKGLGNISSGIATFPVTLTGAGSPWTITALYELQVGTTATATAMTINSSNLIVQVY